MKFITGQPATLFFAWQIDVMLNNFKLNQINLSDVHLVMLHNNDIDPYYDKLIKKYTEAKFYFYTDLRPVKKPITARAYAMASHFDAKPELEEETIFYHDTDIIFLEKLDFKKLEQLTTKTIALMSNAWYLSKSSFNGFLNQAADSIKIDKEVIIKNEQNCGGAQHIIKGVDKNYWLDVYYRTEILEYSLGYGGLASKRADMYALLWSLWMKNVETKIIKELDFCWPFNSIKEKKAIYHDAASKDIPGLFHKHHYKETIPDLNLDINKTYCSSLYYDHLKETLIQNK